jgi:carotenoid cleavage dioxygenase-like enzyme
MLHKFSFRGGKVAYASRFLRSDAYRGARAEGSLQSKEWGTDPCRNLFGAIKAHFVPPELTDNGNIHVITYGDLTLATTETPLPIVFDPDTLATVGHVTYDDELEGQIDPSHPHYDAQGNVYSYLLNFGPSSTYQLYRLDPTTLRRQVVATIATEHPAYMHSFAMTQRSLVLVEFPFVLDPAGTLFRDQPLIDSYQWKPELGTTIHVVDRASGQTTRYQTEPFFAFHHVNAYDDGDRLVMDLVRFDDPSVLHALTLDRLRSDEPTDAAGHLHRLVVDRTGRAPVRSRRLCDKRLELPRIHYEAFHTKRQRYVYGAGNTVEGNWLDDLSKIDVNTGEAKVWREPGCYPGEPMFVPRPHPRTEDDGVLLSIVFDSSAGTSSLLALDARDLRELGRAQLPEVLPMAFHGTYLPKPR